MSSAFIDVRNVGNPVIPEPGGSKDGEGGARGNDRKIRHAITAGGVVDTGQTGVVLMMWITVGSFAGFHASMPPALRDQ
jgi:hypothetical protein